MITFENFMRGTKANFKGCRKPTRKPDYVSSSGSEYWYGKNKNGEYVIRHSDHWTFYNFRLQRNKIASCVWNLKSNYKGKYRNFYGSEDCAGKAYLKNFSFIRFG